MISLREFAKLAGTSPATVSRTFSGNKRISKKTRERLFKLAERYNFRPSAVRPAKIGGKTRSVGVIIPNLEISYFVRHWKNIILNCRIKISPTLSIPIEIPGNKLFGI